MSDDSTDPFCTACGRHLSHLLDEVEQRVRTPAEEAVLRAAVALSNKWALGDNGGREGTALRAAVDALLREEPEWAKEEGRT